MQVIWPEEWTVAKVILEGRWFASQWQFVMFLVSESFHFCIFELLPSTFSVVESEEEKHCWGSFPGDTDVGGQISLGCTQG